MLLLPPPPPQPCWGMRNGGRSQSVTLHLCHFFMAALPLLQHSVRPTDAHVCKCIFLLKSVPFPAFFTEYWMIGNLQIHRLTEQPELETIHKDYWIQLLGIPHRITQYLNPMSDSIVQTLRAFSNSGRLSAMTISLQCLFHCPTTSSGKNLFPVPNLNLPPPWGSTKKRCHFIMKAGRWKRRAYKTINNHQKNGLLLGDLTHEPSRRPYCLLCPS